MWMIPRILLYQFFTVIQDKTRCSRRTVLVLRCGGALIRQSREEAQERSVFRVQRVTAQKRADVQIGDLTTRRRVRFMPNEEAVGIGVSA